MGNRDEYLLNDEREDAAMRRLLTQRMETRFVEPPPDLVTRTARQLPRLPPAAAARAATRQRITHIGVLAVAGLLVLFVALVGALDVMGTGPQLASFFGDGSTGISRTLLIARLLVKPIAGMFFTMMPSLLVVSSVVAVVGGWLWWALARQPLRSMAEEVRQ